MAGWRWNEDNGRDVINLGEEVELIGERSATSTVGVSPSNAPSFRVERMRWDRWARVKATEFAIERW